MAHNTGPRCLTGRNVYDCLSRRHVADTAMLHIRHFLGGKAMRSRSPAVLALLVLTAAALTGPSRIAVSQPAPSTAPEHEIPQSLRLEHEETLNRLAVLTRRPGPEGSAARKALVLFKRHIAREQEYILPPLVLLPDLADGKVTPDMAWAVTMADRVKADRETIFQEHTQLIAALNEILAAARRAHDSDGIEFAQAAATDSLNDVELLEPMTLVVGDYLRGKLPAAH